MADFLNFDKNEYQKAMDKIKLSDLQKSELKSSMQSVADSDTKNDKKTRKTYFNVWTKAVAAVLTLVIIGGAAYFFAGTSKNKNSFSIVANAAEIEDTEITIKSDLVAGTFAPSILERKDGLNFSDEEYKSDWFEHFNLSELSVKGDNIDTVTFKANKNLTYFAIRPMDSSEKIYGEQTDTSNAPVENDEFYNAVQNSFEDIQPLNNSNYKEKENEPLGADVVGKLCDGFTYKNNDSSAEEQTISFGEYVDFMLESDRTDGEMDEYITGMCECIAKSDEYFERYKDEMENGSEKIYDDQTDTEGVHKLTDEEIANLELFDDYRKKLIGKMLDDATIEVTVTFTDGTQQTKVLELEYKDIQEDKLSVSVRLAG